MLLIRITVALYIIALVDALNKAKPAASKGVYLKKISLSSTMGVGIRVDQSTVV